MDCPNCGYPYRRCVCEETAELARGVDKTRERAIQLVADYFSLTAKVVHDYRDFFTSAIDLVTLGLKDGGEK